MTIAINCSPFTTLAGNDYLYDYFLKTAPSKPEHQFIFISSLPEDGQPVASKNMLQLVSSPRANNPLMWKLWLNYTLPGIARKHNADILINTGGVCSLRSKLPQWIFISDLSFLSFPRFFSKKQLHFFEKKMPAFLHKADTIVSASGFVTKEMLQHYSTNEEKIKQFPLVIGGAFQIAGWKEKEVIKEKYAEGKEYFLFHGEIHPKNNLVNLLKAFSFFKKRQKSNMQLIIASGSAPANDPFIESLKTYKYRKEVNLLIGLPQKEFAGITAAAYAFLYPSLYDGLAIFPLKAMQCEVPVITTNTGALIEILQDAALYADPANFEDIADKMMLVFKDENKRSELIKKGRLIVEKNKKDNTDSQCWDSIFTNPIKGNIGLRKLSL